MSFLKLKALVKLLEALKLYLSFKALFELSEAFFELFEALKLYKAPI